MTVTLGLTGSIGMGKSTTARLFEDHGAAIWDADAAVHTLYGPGGAAVAPVEATFPGVTTDGAIDRPRLRAALAQAPDGFDRLDAIVHPLVQADRAQFMRSAQSWLQVFDIPLLFETGAEGAFTTTACVWVAADIQRARVLARPGMDDAALQLILSRQWPIARKRAAAEYEIETTTMRTAIRDVTAIMQNLRDRHA
ncbi:MAG: dephospho-CoA kinase [Shimia sp.]